MVKQAATLTPSMADSFLSEADRLYAQGRHEESVIAIAQALEIALARYAAAVLMPPSAQERSSPGERQLLRKRYGKTIGSLSLGSLRNVVVHLVLRGVRPTVMAEALQCVEEAKHFKRLAAVKEQFAACSNESFRSTAEALRDLSTIELRGAVVHEGYKPTAAEIEEQRVAVTRLAHALSEMLSK